MIPARSSWNAPRYDPQPDGSCLGRVIVWLAATAQEPALDTASSVSWRPREGRIGVNTGFQEA